MKTKAYLWTSIILLVAVSLSGCMLGQAGANRALANGGGLATPTPAAALPSATALVVKTRAPSATPAPTSDPEQVRAEQAEQAARDYFTAVSEGNTEAAASQLSSFSLMVFQLTRGDAQAALQSEKLAGVTWKDLQVLDTQPFDAQTMLVHVTYSESKPAPAATAPAATVAATTVAAASQPEIKDALWPVRLENGTWRYNWNNLIDFRSLDAASQTMNNITILPLQLLRYSDRLQVSLLVQNRTNAAVVFGQVNETLGTFYFGDKAVVAEQTRWILNPLRSVPDATLEIKGLFTTLPERFTIRTWNNLNLPPWFDFQF